MAKISQPVLPQFDRLVRGYVLFNILFLFAALIEVVFLLAFFSFLSQSSIAAFALSIIFLTLFSYLIYRAYFESALPERFESLKNQFIHNFKTVMGFQEGVAEHHAALALSCSRLSDQLAGKERIFYQLPKPLARFTPLIEKFSYLCHWKDILRMRELLLLAAAAEHIKLVKNEPTNLELHAMLANSYVLLSKLYSDQMKLLENEGHLWNLHTKHIAILDDKFRRTSQKAVEELKILNEFAPNDPWVHLQLAYSYRDLRMPINEIQEYETILKINPEDLEIAYKLGVLYFQEGMNAKGLRIYELLKQKHYKKADTLLKNYC